MRRITVSKKSYHVKGHYSHSRTGKRFWVPPHNVRPERFVEYEHLPARRNRVIPTPLKKGDLGGRGFFELSRKSQEKRIAGAIRKYGYKHVLGKLNAIAVLDKRRDPKVSRSASTDRRWAVVHYGGPAHGYDLHKRR